jgi:hypothetical protein
MNEKEKRLLEHLNSVRGILDVPESAFTKIDQSLEKKAKEKRLLENFEKTLDGILHPQPDVPEPEVIVEAPKFVDVVKDNSKKVTDQTVGAVEKQPDLPEKDFVTPGTVALSKPEKPKDEIPAAFRKEMDILKKSVMDLHAFASRISQMGGGGAGSVEELYFRTIVVTGDYTGTNKDYYIGVNSSAPCTITLPKGNKPGRQVVVKDESGACATNNITVITQGTDTIDNDTSAVMAINNMSLTFIYRNGWRII